MPKEIQETRSCRKQNLLGGKVRSQFLHHIFIQYHTSERLGKPFDNF